MGKLFKLKEWVSIPEAARRLAITFGEEVTEADLLKLALDGHLRLSVHFVNHATALCGSIGVPGKARFVDFPIDVAAACKKEQPSEGYQGGHKKMRMGIKLNNGEVIDLEDEIVTLNGVYDLPMIGDERLDIERKFQRLTDGPAVTLIGLDGAFVMKEDIYFQIQEDFEDNSQVIGSRASLEALETHILVKQIDATEAVALLAQHKKHRKKFLEKRKSKPSSEHYYPAGGLPEDSVLVVRTDALIEFEQSLQGVSGTVDRPLSTRERDTLLTIIAVLCKDAGYDYSKPAKTAGLIQSTAAGMGVSISETAIENHLKKIPDALGTRTR